ncbi:MAG: GNAT family N-acetyltransferase [Alphaproteobacteria bacterium]|nr:GNAT family N-acetyltransferase [Alphaproteobacteria bacterium]
MTSAFSALDFQSDYLHWRDSVTSRDIPAIRAMLQATANVKPQEIENAAIHARDAMEKGTQSDFHFTLANYNGELIGFACYGRIADTQNRYELRWIVVHPDWQGCGVGRMLMRQVEHKAKAKGALRFYIESASRPKDITRCFYERCGYSRQAELEGFYSDAVGKVIYTKDLFEAVQTSLNDEVDSAA